MRLGTIDTIIGAMTAKFGRHPRILIVCILWKDRPKGRSFLFVCFD